MCAAPIQVREVGQADDGRRRRCTGDAHAKCGGCSWKRLRDRRTRILSAGALPICCCAGGPHACEMAATAAALAAMATTAPPLPLPQGEGWGSG
eukprot:1287480-Pleurochrysis_carterae.AAC.2